MSCFHGIASNHECFFKKKIIIQIVEELATLVALVCCESLEMSIKLVWSTTSSPLLHAPCSL